MGAHGAKAAATTSPPHAKPMALVHEGLSDKCQMLECWNAGMLECWNVGMLE
jgi:hypothetical protein